MHNISIIIPTLNEAENLNVLLPHLVNTATTKNIIEILVVDCNSQDSTQEVIEKQQKKFPIITLLQAEKGRAKQMNLGAQLSKGSILYFLHADTFPPTGYDKYILKNIEQQNRAGCFRMKFDSNHWWLKLAGWLTRFNHKACRGGDQSLFISKNLFYELGTFNERFTVYEDQDFINKLYKKNEFTVIPKWITTSARRYETNGVWRLQYHFWAIYFKKFLGASADDLYQYYLKNIKS